MLYRSCDSRPDGRQLRSFSPSAVTRVVSRLLAATKEEAQRNWLAAVATMVHRARPDLSDSINVVVGTRRLSEDILAGLSIGEISVCYEALLSRLDRSGRRDAGQYFTPDDAALFMADQAARFPAGTWIDPCCGVGNLSWYLTAAQPDSGEFIRSRLQLCDSDEVAVRTAVALLSGQYARSGDNEGVLRLHQNSQCADFLKEDTPVTADYAIANPPYARVPAEEKFETSATREAYAYFIEKIAKTTQGFVAVTPSAYLSAPKYRQLRAVLDKNTTGGEVYVFDNVPDTLFRGYKFGSVNTSKTNFVRAAITVSFPAAEGWSITPILRWKSKNRPDMFAGAHRLLARRRTGPGGEWAKVPPTLTQLWDHLSGSPKTIRDLRVRGESPWSLTVASTPRYFVSAAFRDLRRASKIKLYFPSQEFQELAAAVLNSSLPYFWWRSLDGGLTLPVRILLSVPVPTMDVPRALVDQLRNKEGQHLVAKLNSGRVNENVKRPEELVRQLNRFLVPDGTPSLDIIYLDSMFASKQWLEAHGNEQQR